MKISFFISVIFISWFYKKSVVYQFSFSSVTGMLVAATDAYLLFNVMYIDEQYLEICAFL